MALTEMRDGEAAQGPSSPGSTTIAAPRACTCRSFEPLTLCDHGRYRYKTENSTLELVRCRFEELVLTLQQSRGLLRVQPRPSVAPSVRLHGGRLQGPVTACRGGGSGRRGKAAVAVKRLPRKQAAVRVRGVLTDRACMLSSQPTFLRGVEGLRRSFAAADSS